MQHNFFVYPLGGIAMSDPDGSHRCQKNSWELIPSDLDKPEPQHTEIAAGFVNHQRSIRA